MSRVTNSQRLRYESNAGPKDHQQHRINPLARWEEDWGEGKEAQPSSSATTYHRLRTNSTKATPDHKDHQQHRINPLAPLGRGLG